MEKYRMVVVVRVRKVPAISGEHRSEIVATCNNHFFNFISVSAERSTTHESEYMIAIIMYNENKTR